MHASNLTSITTESTVRHSYISTAAMVLKMSIKNNGGMRRKKKRRKMEEVEKENCDNNSDDESIIYRRAEV